MSSAPVKALFEPPLDEMYRSNSPSAGNRFVPRKSICSQKCARPGHSSGLDIEPTATFIEAAALLASGSEHSSTRSPLLSWRPRKLRRSSSEAATSKICSCPPAPATAEAGSGAGAASSAAVSESRRRRDTSVGTCMVASDTRWLVAAARLAISGRIVPKVSRGRFPSSLLCGGDFQRTTRGNFRAICHSCWQ